MKIFWKKLLYPPMWVLFFLLPTGLALMLWGMLRLGQSHPVTIAGDALSFYALSLWCLRLPKIIAFFKRYREENPYLHRWIEDVRLRVKVILLGNVLWNSGYAALQLGLGIYHRSAWFCSLAGYYLCLGLMRLFLLSHLRQHRPGQDRHQELILYRRCGWIFLGMNLALSAMTFHMIYKNRITHHHQITTITLAAYTFLSMTMAIVNLVRYRKYHSPVFSASRAVSLAAAGVSMLSLTGTMLATFNSDAEGVDIQAMMRLAGGALTVFIITMAVFMIVKANGQIKELRNGK